MKRRLEHIGLSVLRTAVLLAPCRQRPAGAAEAEHRRDRISYGTLTPTCYQYGDQMMKMVTASVLVLTGSVLMAGQATSHIKTIPDQTITATATIEAIDQTMRIVTVRMDDGTDEQLLVPADVQRFSQLKIGDKITARYYASLIVRLKQPGEASVDVTDAAVTPTNGARPGGTLATQRTLTVTITAIDPKVPSITVESADGWTYSRKVNDRKALEKVKVGDRLDVTWNDAVLISAASAK
jgi:hypothetical protein